MFVKRMVLAALLIVALGQTTALAHGDLASAIPEPDTELGKPPSHIIINFTEPPTKNSVVKVKDGCGVEITDSVDFSDGTAHVFTDKGEPGDWKVSYEVVSAQDGHKTEGSYGFKILGKKDCSTGGGIGDDLPKANDGGGSGNLDDGSSFPVVPVVLGGAGVIALALVARRLAG
ncbi:MAG TPA: copper resistance CopC family protein [Actinomycetota bacterium]|nr:copper resistance CopC family protein [Actinomycetota bacterium]